MVDAERPLPWRQGLPYGALALPLAFVALPLYVLLPDHYARAFGMPLAWLGALLLGARLLDAVIDPWLGRWVDGLLGQQALRAWKVAAVAGMGAALGFVALFFPPAGVTQGLPALLAWCALALTLTYLCYSLLTLVHQAWGTRLGGSVTQRARVVAWREGLALLGVLAASVLPSLAGLPATATVFALALALGLWLLRRGPRPAAAPKDGRLQNAALQDAGPPSAAHPNAIPAVHSLPDTLSHTLPHSLLTPLRQRAFRSLLAVYLLNGIASAIPATLVLFFIRDKLQAPAFEPLFLGSYFAAAALSMPLWVRAVARLGLVKTWALGMAMAVAVFVWAAGLGPGDVLAYTLVCVFSGAAMGADLTVAPTLLGGVIEDAGHAQEQEGLYFGWWNFATKLNLALAAGLSLPALQALGYQAGSTSPQALGALTLAYCALPCLLKLGALALLWRHRSQTHAPSLQAARAA